MNRTKLALIAMLALIILMATPIHIVNLVSANFLPAPAMSIISPLPVTYRNASVPLNFGANALTGDPEVVYLRYSIDGNANVTLTNLKKTSTQNFAANKTGFTYHVGEMLMLNNLDDGNHTLRVYSHDANGNEMSGSVEFTVDAHNETSTQTDNFFSPQNPLLLITIVFVVLVSLLIAILLFKKKTKDTSMHKI